MNIYKEFLHILRNEELEVVYLQILDDLTPEIVNIVKCICNTKFSVLHGELHTYYDDIKKLVSVFITFWNEAMDEAIKEADRYCGTITKDSLLEIIEKTADIQKSKQILFGKEFLPISQAGHMKVYEDIEKKFQDYLEKIHEMKEKVELFDKPKLSEDFIKENMEISKQKTYDIFVTTHKYVSMMLADHLLPNIRLSLEEIICRVRSNLRSVQAESEETLDSLKNELYEKNKAHLMLYREERKSSVALAETAKAIENLRARIETSLSTEAVDHLEEELYYWESKRAELDDVVANVETLKSELKEIEDQEILYEKINNFQETPVHCSKNKCWNTTGDNLKQRKELLKQKINEASQTLFTYFGTRGPNHKIYTNETGKFYIDEYNHKVYLFEHGIREYHLNCDGSVKQTDQNKSMPRRDDYGRYFLNKDGGKIYQRAQCGSSYQLADNNLMEKKDKDCGHTVKPNTGCKIEMRDPFAGLILPNVETMDIKESLDPEVVKYLWDSFGPLLHHALFDVANLKPKNPIQYLAHRILAHKYNRTGEELKKKKEEAEDHRANIYKERKEKAIAATKAWKDKLPKSAKPEDLDDSQATAAYEAARAANEFTLQLGYCD